MFGKAASFCVLAVVVATAFFGTVSIARAASPSFDCGKASDAADLAICSDDGLAELDIQTTAEWRRLRGSDKDSATRIAREFLKVRKACGSDKGCIRKSQEQALANFYAAGPSGAHGDQSQRAQHHKAIVITVLCNFEESETFHYDISTNAATFKGDKRSPAFKEIYEICSTCVWEGAHWNISDKEYSAVKSDGRHSISINRYDITAVWTGVLVVGWGVYAEEFPVRQNGRCKKVDKQL